MLKLKNLVRKIENIEADIVISQEGIVEVWNTLATGVFGWTEGEAIGTLLETLVIPERYREAHRKGLERFRLTASGLELCQQLRVHGLHKEGYEIELEVSVLASAADGVTRFLGFIQQIHPT